MKKLNHLPLLAGVMVLAVLLMACAAALEPTPPTEVPTFTPEPPTPEPPTATPLPTPGKSSEVPRITVQELKERLDSGASIMILDTRSQRSFDQEHIAGALVKLDSYEAVPKEQEIVFYCS